MPREPETVDDYLWSALFAAGEKIGEKEGREAIGTMKYTKQMSIEQVVNALRAAEKADVPHQFLRGCAKRKKPNGSVVHPRPPWCVSEDALNYYGRQDKHGNKQTLEKAVRV